VSRIGFLVNFLEQTPVEELQAVSQIKIFLQLCVKFFVMGLL